MAAVESLAYAVRPRLVAAYLGHLAFLVGWLCVPMLAVAAIEREWSHALGFSAVLIVLIAGGWLLQRHRPSGEIQTNEALVVVAGIFVLTSLALAVPMMTAGVGFVDALFEAVSGITTTGLSTFATVEDKPRSLVFAAAWLQWLGGIGIMVLSFALLFGQGATSKRLTSVLGKQEGMIGGTRAYAAIIVRVYIVLTVAGIAALALAGLDWFPALTLTLSAVSTGGYSPYNSSIGDLLPLAQTAVVALGLAGAIAIPLYHDFVGGKPMAFIRDREIQILVAIVATVTALLILRSYMAPAAHRAGGLDVLLTVVSAQSTAGFSVVPISEFDPFTKFGLIFSMFVGGGVGSTAGGIKLLRLIVLIRLLQIAILRTRLTPHAATSNRIDGRDWNDDELLKLFVVVGLFVGAIALSWLPFLWMGYDPLDSLFEVVSATGTVGLSTGITGPDLPVVLKAVLCIDMIAGRLEILPLLVLLAPRTWIGHHKE